MTRRRVAITGLGQISALGSDLDVFWREVTGAAPRPVAGSIIESEADGRLVPRKIRRRADPFASHALIAARRALQDADLAPDGLDPRRGGIVLSTVYGALQSLDRQEAVRESKGDSAVTSHLAVQACENIAAASIAATIGWRGPCRTIVTACAGGTHAAAEGADLVANGRLDAVLVGGTQGPLSPALTASYRNMRVLSPTGWVRPFDTRRDGFAFAEGAAVLLLEPLPAARARGARIYAEVWGSGHTNDAGSLSRPSGPAVAECMLEALETASVEPADIVHVNAHGTGTALNDRQEAEALHEVFGAKPPPTSSIKRVLGHPFGASGAFEAIAAALTVHHGVLPSLGTDVHEDTTLELDLVTGPPRPIRPGPVLSNSLGLGGQNGSLVLGPAAPIA